MTSMIFLSLVVNMVMLTALPGWCSSSPPGVPNFSCPPAVAQPASMASDLLQDALVACSRAHSHLLSLREPATAAAFPEGLTFQEADEMMSGYVLVALPAAPEARAGDARTSLQRTRGSLERFRRAMETLWPEWMEDGAFRYLGRIDVNLRNVQCALERLLQSVPSQGPVPDPEVQETDTNAPAEADSLRTESGSGRKMRDWLFLRHYTQFLLVLGRQLEALGSSTLLDP